jgi:hypothetical protein
LALVGAFCAAARTAYADAPSSATAVVLVQGTAGPATNATLEQLIAGRVHVADRAAFLARAAVEGAPRALTMPPPAKTIQALKRAAKHEHVDVIVLIRTTVTAHARQVAVDVIDVEAGISYPVQSIRLPLHPGKDEEAKLTGLLADLDAFVASLPPKGPSPLPPTTPAVAPVVALPPPPAPSSAPVVSPAETPRPPRGGDIAYAIATAEVDFDAGARGFSYSDGFTKNLRSYSLGFAPGIAGWAEVYPFGGLDQILADLGLVGDVRSSLALHSQSAGSAAVDTTWFRFDVGVKYRLHFGATEHPVALGVSASYARESFTFSPEAASYPAVVYSSARLELDGRVPLGPVGLTASAGYLPVLASENVINFRGTDAEGLELSLGIAIRVASGWEIDARALYTRFFLSYNPSPGDAYVAGGALDQFLHGELGVKAFY